MMGSGKMTTFCLSSRYVAFYMILVMIWDTTQEELYSTKFQAVNNVDVSAQIDQWTKQKQSIRSEMRCASLCVTSACECSSFSYDNVTGSCFMFTKTISNDDGSGTGANKLTECVVPRVIEHSTLTDYTGCNASYDCNFGYEATDGSTLICQSNETWAPSNFSCAEIPCPTPPTLVNGNVGVTSLQVNGTATYTCIPDYINRGGNVDTLTCQLGGTWLGTIDLLCKPITIRYTFYWTTSADLWSGTDAVVWVQMYGTYGAERVVMPGSLSLERATSESNWVNKTYIFKPPLIWYDVGPLTKVDIGHDNGGSSPGWKLQTVTIVMDGIGSYQFYADAWVETPSLKITVYI